MKAAIVAQAWATYPEDRASRLVYMTTHGVSASVARQYAEGPCGRGQNPKRDGCTAAQKGKNAPGGGGNVHGPKAPRKQSANPRPSKTMLDRKKAEARHAAEDSQKTKPTIAQVGAVLGHLPEASREAAQKIILAGAGKGLKIADVGKIVSMAPPAKRESIMKALTAVSAKMKHGEGADAKKRAPSEAQREKAEDRADAKQRKRQAKAKADSDFKTGGAKGRERARDEAIAKRRD